MQRLRISSFILSLLIICSARSQVAVDVRVDSLQFFIGEQTDITLSVSLDKGQKLELPNLRKGSEIIPDIEVIEVKRPDTTFLNEGKRLEIQQKYTITAWDSSFYYLPPFEVKVDGKEYKSKTLALKVYTVDVDTLHLDKFFPPYGIMEPPFAWEDWKLVVLAAFAMLLAAMGAFVLYYHVLTGKPIVRIIRRKKKLPPHKVAIDEIERIKSERKWTDEDSKEYYTELTDALRKYIQERYGFNALEMTSSEIIEHLLEVSDEEGLRELRELFVTADLVKFAKYVTQINENDANLVAAVEFINNTKVEADPNAAAEPEIIRETDTKRENEVRWMRVAMVVLGLASIALAAFVVWRALDIIM